MNRILELNNKNEKLKQENSTLERYNESLKEIQERMQCRYIENTEWYHGTRELNRKLEELQLA